MALKKAILVLALLVLAPVLAQAQEDETTSSTIDAGNETTEYFENQEEMTEKAADVLQIIMSIVRDILRYIQTTLSEMPVTE